MSTDLIVREDPILSAPELRSRVQVIQQVMRDVMVEGTHYGTIPGTQKPSLWKPGAEKLAMAFGISISTEIAEERVHEEEVFYRVRATARGHDGRELGSTEGVCSTRERKYRWRKPVHIKEWEATPEHLRRVTWDKEGNEVLQVRTEPGDLINTILQMADKRAYVGLVRKVTAASDIFVQELEDEEPEPEKAPVQQPQAVAPMEKLQAELPVDDGGPPAVQVASCKKIKSGESEKGPWTLYGVTDSLGHKSVTYSLTIFAACQKAMAEKGWVRILTVPGGEGKDPRIEEIVPVKA
jgi:hypothetical protein